MEITKVIITSIKENTNLIADRFKLKKINNSDNLEIFTGKREYNEENEQIVLVFSDFDKNNLEKTISFINDNYILEKIIYIGNSYILNDVDIKLGDVIIPNTFIMSNEEDPLFINYAIGNSFDLNKFGLILSGVCLTTDSFKKSLEENSDFIADIYDNEIYSLLSIINKNDLLEKTVVIKETLDSTSVNNLKNKITGNSINVLELIL